MQRPRCCALICVATAVAFCACGGKTTTAPSTTETTTTTSGAEPTITESWTGTVPVGGAAFYSFSIAEKGTVEVTLERVSGQFVPSTIMLGLGIGTPNGTSCDVTATTTVQAGSSPQVTGTYDAGLYCARVSDLGNLWAPATVSVSIAHP